MKYFLMMLYAVHAIGGLYTYDRINNRPITFDSSFSNVYYTSANFHSIEFAKLNNSQVYRMKPYLKIRPNSTQSLPVMKLH